MLLESRTRNRLINVCRIPSLSIYQFPVIPENCATGTWAACKEQRCQHQRLAPRGCAKVQHRSSRPGLQEGRRQSRGPVQEVTFLRPRSQRISNISPRRDEDGDDGSWDVPAACDYVPSGSRVCIFSCSMVLVPASRWFL